MVMDLEQELRETYDARLGGLDVSGGDVVTARRTGARMRMRRRFAVGAAAVAVVAVAVGGSLVGTGRVTIGPSGDTGHWRELPAAPLSPRADSLAVWTGTEVIVLGGEENPCPPNADCAVAGEDLRDGAAYDPATNSWRRIVGAPVPVGPGDRLVQVGDEVVLRHWLQGGSEWYVYEPPADRWTPMHGVPERVADLPSALGSDLYVLAGRRLAHYSAVTGRWNLLPPDLLTPRLVERRVTATSSGVVVTGYDATKPNDGRSPSVVLVDAWDGTSWRRLPATGQVGNNGWFWTGTYMVDPEPGTEDGGQVDGWDHAYPMGGKLDLTTGRWSSLPSSFTDTSGGWGVNASDGRWVATYGQVYNTETGEVGTLPRPEGAPDSGVTAAWAGDRLLASGGATFDATGAHVTNRAWLWTP
jgi:hypothetical protein